MTTAATRHKYAPSLRDSQLRVQCTTVSCAISTIAFKSLTADDGRRQL